MPSDIILSIDAEVLHEAAANLWNEFARYRKEHGIPEGDKGPVMIMEDRVSECYQKTLYIKSREDFDRLRGELDYARSCLQRLKELDHDAQPT